MHNNSAYRVVVVDDVPEIRVLLSEVLSLSGRFQVVGEAADGLEAIDQVQQHQPDLVILDLSMPRMDGLEALPKILERSPRSKVVVLSAFEEKRLGRAALESGAACYLEKGLHPHDLVQELFRVLDSG